MPSLVEYRVQTPYVFAGTVAENISYGSPWATPADIAGAAARAMIAREIESLPGG